MGGRPRSDGDKMGGTFELMSPRVFLRRWPSLGTIGNMVMVIGRRFNDELNAVENKDT